MKGAQSNGSILTVYEYSVLPKGSGIAPHAENFLSSGDSLRKCDNELPYDKLVDLVLLNTLTIEKEVMHYLEK